MAKQPKKAGRPLKKAKDLDEALKAAKPVREDEQSPDPTPTESTGTRENPSPTVPATAARPSGPKVLVGLSERIKAEAASAPPHVIVQALAGTGKTTTIVEGMKRIKGVAPDIEPSPQQQAVWDQMALGKSDLIRFTAFNNSIASELKGRMQRFGLLSRGCDACTMHSMGNEAVKQAYGRQNPSGFAVTDIVAKLMACDPKQLKRLQPVVAGAVERLASLCKMNLMEPTEENLEQLASHHDVDMEGDGAKRADNRRMVIQMVPQVLEESKNPRGTIAFDDMIWLPVVQGLSVPRFDVLLGDEFQDWNLCQQALARKAGERLILVGDEHQAIYGFAGADSEAMRRMESELKADQSRKVQDFEDYNSGGACVVLPLTVTRRCGKAIVQEARRYVPEFEAHPSNPEGLVGRSLLPFVDGKERPEAETYLRLATDGDFVLCRTNAPLISECFRFLKAGRKANIQGRDVCQGLIKTLEKSNAQSVPEFVRWLSEWLERERAKEEAKRHPSDQRLQTLQDRHDCLICFTGGCQNISDVRGKIDRTFGSKECRRCNLAYDAPEFQCVRCKGVLTDRPGVKMSSIHKAKGLEARRVFFLQPPGGPREDRMKPWERRQENNLRYVAITRAIEELYHVT